MENLIYPIRINRYLAKKNICSRREADALVMKGIVKINGKMAVVGDKVQESDQVEIEKKNKKSLKEYEYFAFYKPIGVVTHSPSKGQKEIRDIAGVAMDVFPVGRLDFASHGLIVLTNDGRVNERLLSPENNHEKEYHVVVDKKVNNQFLKHMRRGIQLEDFLTKECEVEKTNEYSFRIVLTEGKKHQIRRMCAALGFQVMDLKRVRIMNITMRKMGAGQKRLIKDEELNIFLKKLNLC